jgi:uncharacterized protein YwgA
MHSQPLRNLMGLLGLIQASGGTVEGRLRIQKEAFLLGKMGSPYFDTGEFVYHFYGPYSRAVSDALHDAVAAGLIDEIPESFSDEVTRYRYRLSDAGSRFLDAAALSFDKHTAEVVGRLKTYHWRALELASTVAFLEQTGELAERSEAFKEAIQLKPACKHYRDDANRVLTEIGV